MSYSLPPFEKFASIERLDQKITITEKIHGTNAQIYIYEEHDEYLKVVQFHVLAGSRERWLQRGKLTDNYGFAAWVEDNREALINTLGVGRHYGEWYGSGINSGYGLKDDERRLALFNTHKWAGPYQGGKLPPGIEVVPILYSGPYVPGIVEKTMTELRLHGSHMQQGFMKPEGIVTRYERSGVLFKSVFEVEETGWQGKSRMPDEKYKAAQAAREAGKAYLQPIRLEKLLSRDEQYTAQYPASLPIIAKAYCEDLEKEMIELNKISWTAARKAIYPWIKEVLEGKGYKA